MSSYNEGNTGRPKKEIDKKTFESLCAIQCTQVEVCSVMGICEDTLQSWCKKTYKKGFSEVFKEKRQAGRASLRRMQWKLAEKNATMGIWLGKQYLEQHDETNIIIPDGDVKFEFNRRPIE